MTGRGLREVTMYRQIGETWKGELKEKSPALRERIIAWRKGPRVVRIEHPTRLDRARSLGFKAKQGFLVVRVRISRGGIRIKRPVSGRRPKHLGVVRIKGQLNEGKVVARRVKQRYPNLIVLGSYFLTEDGKYRWFESILVDPNHPAIIADKELSSIVKR